MATEANYHFQINYEDRREGNFIQNQGDLAWTQHELRQSLNEPNKEEIKSPKETDGKNSAERKEQSERQKNFQNNECFKKKSIKPTRLEKIFSLDVASTAYCNEKKYDEAYGLLRRQYKLGASVGMIPVLIDYYDTLFKTYRGEESRRVFGRMVATIKESLKSSIQECLELGHKYRESEEYFKGLLFYQIGGVLLEDVIDADRFLSDVQECAQGMKLCVMGVVENMPTYIEDVKLLIIPNMHKMIKCFSNLKGKRKKGLCVVKSLCLHHIEFCEFLVGNLPARENTLRAAINLLSNTLGEDEAKRHRVYGIVLNNLAATLLQKHKPTEAKSMLIRAIAVNKTAEDYGSDEERKKDWDKSQASMAKADEMLESS